MPIRNDCSDWFFVSLASYPLWYRVALFPCVSFFNLFTRTRKIYDKKQLIWIEKKMNRKNSLFSDLNTNFYLKRKTQNVLSYNFIPKLARSCFVIFVNHYTSPVCSSVSSVPIPVQTFQLELGNESVTSCLFYRWI